MSILIKGMKMPKGCWWRENGSYMECPLFDADQYCSQLRRCTNSIDGNRPYDCPLIKVPTPHGRLTDVGTLIKTLQELFDKKEEEARFAGNRGVTVTWNDAIYHIKIAPIIIEAEEGEDE